MEKTAVQVIEDMIEKQAVLGRLLTGAVLGIGAGEAIGQGLAKRRVPAYAGYEDKVKEHNQLRNDYLATRSRIIDDSIPLEQEIPGFADMTMDEFHAALAKKFHDNVKQRLKDNELNKQASVAGVAKWLAPMAVSAIPAGIGMGVSAYKRGKQERSDPSLIQGSIDRNSARMAALKSVGTMSPEDAYRTFVTDEAPQDDASEGYQFRDRHLDRLMQRHGYNPGAMKVSDYRNLRSAYDEATLGDPKKITDAEFKALVKKYQPKQHVIAIKTAKENESMQKTACQVIEDLLEKEAKDRLTKFVEEKARGLATSKLTGDKLLDQHQHLIDLTGKADNSARQAIKAYKKPLEAYRKPDLTSLGTDLNIADNAARSPLKMLAAYPQKAAKIVGNGTDANAVVARSALADHYMRDQRSRYTQWILHPKKASEVIEDLLEKEASVDGAALGAGIGSMGSVLSYTALMKKYENDSRKSKPGSPPAVSNFIHDGTFDQKGYYTTLKEWQKANPNALRNRRIQMAAAAITPMVAGAIGGHLLTRKTATETIEEIMEKEAFAPEQTDASKIESPLTSLRKTFRPKPWEKKTRNPLVLS